MLYKTHVQPAGLLVSISPFSGTSHAAIEKTFCSALGHSAEVSLSLDINDFPQVPTIITSNSDNKVNVEENKKCILLQIIRCCSRQYLIKKERQTFVNEWTKDL